MEKYRTGDTQTSKEVPAASEPSASIDNAGIVDVKDDSLGLVTVSLAHRIGDIAADCRASAVFVYVDALGERALDLPSNLEQRVFYVTKTTAEDDAQTALHHHVIRVPNVSLGRLSQVKLAVLIALTRKLLRPRDTIVCLSGPTDSGELDTLVVMRLDREFEMFLMPHAGEEMAPDVSGEVLERVINIAAELATDGREGRPVGALFVIGDTSEVSELSRQLVLNPFAGYTRKERSILDPDLEETVKEYATIDGAFLIWDDGVLESAGTYLKPARQEEYTLPHGLGARHQAAAAITSITKSVAITVSQSTGTVTIFRRGAIVTEIEKPRGHARAGCAATVSSEEGVET